MIFSVVKTGGKQYKVAEGSVIEVERLATPAQEAISFSEVLLIADGDSLLVGKPFVDGAKVTGTVLEHLKGEKIRVAHFKAKARSRKIHGHRQYLSKVKIEKIAFPGQKVASKPVEEKEDKKPAAKRATKKS